MKANSQGGFIYPILSTSEQNVSIKHEHKALLGHMNPGNNGSDMIKIFGGTGITP
jgi:hypothetical protein